MPTLFERIIAREIPGDIVHQDDRVRRFATSSPVHPCMC